MAQWQYRDPTLIQVLSLYLLLFAFFVLLFNLSRAEDSKSKAVAESLNSTFSAEGALGRAPEILVSVEGDVPDPPDLQRAVGRLVKTAIPIAEVKILKPGHLLQARFPERAMFGVRSAAIRAERIAGVRDIARAVAAPPPGVRYDIDITLAAPARAARSDREAEARTIGRAARLAELLVHSGAPSGTVAGGIGPGEAGWVSMLFHVRSRQEARLKLDPAIRDAAP